MKPYRIKKRGNIFYVKLQAWKDFRSLNKITGKIITTKGEAQKYAAQLFKADAMSTIPTFQEYANNFFIWNKCKWIKRQHAKKKSFSEAVAKMRRAHLLNYIFPKWGNIHVNQLNAVDIENWLIELELSGQTKNHILYSFKIIMKEIYRERIINYNPLATVEAVTIKAKKRDTLTLDEIKKLFPVLDSELLEIWENYYWASAFFTLLTTGMRIGELRALLWKDINWQAGAIEINKAVKANNEVGKTKNQETRAVFIPQRALNYLLSWKDRSLFNQNDCLIFFGELPDKTMGRKSFNKHFNKGLNNAEIDKRDGLVVHSLRHTYNTRMRKLLPEAMLRFQVGHKTEKMTNNYDNNSAIERLLAFQNERQAIDKAWN